MFIGVPLVGRKSSRVRSSEVENSGSEISKEGSIIRIFGSSDGVPGWYNPEGYYWSMRAPRYMY